MLSSHRLLQDLVRIPSVNPMGRAVNGDQFYEFRLTDYLERFFRELGVACERRPVAPLRDNIVASFNSGSPTSILLEVHQDTVPVDGMTIDPFGGEIRGGKLYGRGSCDVKGGMAAMLTAFARLVKEKPAGAANVILACTVDEEHTFVGVQQLMKEGLRADFAVVAEPTKLQIVDAHKGVVRWKVRTEGRACHSSRPDQGVNAVYRMGHVLPLIEEYSGRLIGLTPHARLGPPTLSVGRIEGGVSVNTVPDGCVIEVDRRLLPGEDPHVAWRDCWHHLKETWPVAVVVDPIWLACPALDNDRADEVRQRLGTAIDAVAGRHEVLAVPFGTDASSIALAGTPAVVFGPGDIAQAHTKDEWIELDQVDRAAEILYKFFVG